MGQKTSPIGLRLGIVKTWDSRWFARRNYAELLREDLLIKRYLKKRLYQAGISKITIERKGEKVTIGIRTARPGLVIGRKGEQVDKLSEEMKAITKKAVPLNIEEIKRADLDAQLVAEHIAKQLEQRVVPACDEEGDRIVDARGCPGHSRRVLGTPRRLGDGAIRDLPRGAGSAPHAARRHRFRARDRDDRVRHLRRQGVDVPRRGARQGGSDGAGAE
jgi:hypothetical protein